MIVLNFGDFQLDDRHIMPNYEYSQVVNPNGDFVIGVAAMAQFKFSLNNRYQDLPNIDGLEFDLYFISQEFTPYTFKDNTILLFENGDNYTFPHEISRKQVGKFIANYPDKKNDNLLMVTAYDRMSKFEAIIDDWDEKQSYPVTAKQMLKRLCEFVGVPLYTTSFLNDDYVIQKRYRTKNATGRDMLKWLSELAACYCVIDRDGRVLFNWYRPLNVLVNELKYIKIDVSEYKTAPVDKLQVRVSDNAIDVIVGTGKNAYVIQNNPLLYAINDAEIRPLATKIFDAIKGFSYIPYSVTATGIDCNCGDIINLKSKKGVLFSSPVMQVVKKRTSSIELRATGNRLRNTQIGGVNHSIQMLRGKSNEIVANLDEFSVKLTEVKSETDKNTAQLEILANGVTITVDSTGTNTSIKADKDVTLTATDKISGKTSTQVISGGAISISSTSIIINGATKVNGTLSASSMSASSFTGTVYASYVSGTLSTGNIPTLDISSKTSGVLSAGRVSGTLSSESIPSLSASKITSGTFSISRIPNIDSSRIPSLDAGKITSGTFSASRIPNLDASKITSGTLNSSRLPTNLTISTLTATTRVTSNYDIWAKRNLECDGAFLHGGSSIGFFGRPAVSKKYANGIDSLLSALRSYGLIG